MKEPKAMSQMKGPDKPPEKQLHEVEMGKLLEKELRKMIVKIIQDLRKRMGDKDWEDTRNVSKRPRRTKEQTEMKNKITEVKNTLEGIDSRITEAEEWISDMEDRMVITVTEQHIEKEWKEMKIA